MCEFSLKVGKTEGLKELQVYVKLINGTYRRFKRPA